MIEAWPFTNTPWPYGDAQMDWDGESLRATPYATFVRDDYALLLVYDRSWEGWNVEQYAHSRDFGWFYDGDANRDLFPDEAAARECVAQIAAGTWQGWVGA